MAKTQVAPDEQAAKLQADLDQAGAQILSLTERLKDLSGFQKEAVDSRDWIARLTGQVDALTAELAQAKSTASAAEASAKSAGQNAAADANTVEAAKALVDAIKKLS